MECLGLEASKRERERERELRELDVHTAVTKWCLVEVRGGHDPLTGWD